MVQIDADEIHWCRDHPQLLVAKNPGVFASRREILVDILPFEHDRQIGGIYFAGGAFGRLDVLRGFDHRNGNTDVVGRSAL